MARGLESSQFATPPHKVLKYRDSELCPLLEFCLGEGSIVKRVCALGSFGQTFSANNFHISSLLSCSLWYKNNTVSKALQWFNSDAVADIRVKYVGCYHHGSGQRAINWLVLDQAEGQVVNLENCAYKCAVLDLRYVGLTVVMLFQCTTSDVFINSVAVNFLNPLKLMNWYNYLS